MTTQISANPASLGQMPPRSGESADLLHAAERIRLEATKALDPLRRARLGQFLTPAPVAESMASMLTLRKRRIRVLDPGAGTGCLTAALTAQLISKRKRPELVTAICYEIDAALTRPLAETLRICRRAAQAAGIELAYEIRTQDYIADSAGDAASIFAPEDDKFDCVIMNPPYRKIHSSSAERGYLRGAGIETTNLYTGFMLLAARQLRPGGEFVSINPRSFCNGPYFRPFRREFLSTIAIDEVHVFESRRQAFKDDDVLQENIIIYGHRSDRSPAETAVSMTGSDGAITRRRVPYSRLVHPEDQDSVLHVATEESADVVARRIRTLNASLCDLGLMVSTGRVVDFRAREALRPEPTRGTVPLIYPAHFHDGVVKWPNGQTRKPNAIIADSATASLLVDSGFYVLTKRFSAKEERRRVVAALYDPRTISADRVGFENHLNYFHAGGAGIDEQIARGLTIYLNSTAVDLYFRQFSGHTQVNASDLRKLHYPSQEQLRGLARAINRVGDQEEVDRAFDEVLQSF